MGRLKILHVYKSFNVYNGLIEILMILAQNMNHDQYELGVCVYEYDDNEFGQKFQQLGGKIYNLNISSKLLTKHEEFMGLYNFFRQHKPDVVQTHVLKANLYGTMAARFAKVPVVIATEMTLKDIAPTNLKRFRDRLIHPMVSLIISKCDRFMVTSQFIKNEWVDKKNENRFEVIYPPFNMEKYDAAIRNPKKSTGSTAKRIGFVGRLSEEKSVKTLISAIAIVARSHPDVKLSIVGTGPSESELKAQCDELNLNSNITFEGYKSNSFESLKEMDVFVLPSRTEGCPIVVLEAMAMGLPVIATNVGGNPELVIDGKTGYLVPVDSSECVAANIEKLITNRTLSRELGLNGKNRAFTEFHPASFTSKLQNLYRQLCV
jgi:glycosyltransferase involved in cell wall biosynthesis